MPHRRPLLVLVAVGWAAASCAPAPPPPVLSELPEFSLTERDGTTVTRDDLAGHPWIADFVFTRCIAYCPRLTARMLAMREDLPPEVRSVSFTVDPEHDTPEVLRDYARKWGVRGREWLFLTGDREAIWELIRQGFLLPVEEQPQVEASPILHSNRFALVDARGRLRGTYEAFDDTAIERLRSDLAALERESTAR